MKKMYFNEHEFSEAVKLQETDPYKAEEYYEEYFMKYPLDYNSYPYYVSLLILLGKFKKAKDILEYVEKKASLDSNYSRNTYKYSFLNYGIFICRIKLLIFGKKYRELIKYFYENIDNIKGYDLDNSLNSVIYYCQRKIGKLDIDRKDTKSYLFRQIINYQDDDFKNHIKKHLLSYGETNNQYVFNDNFPVEALIKEIKKIIPNKSKLYHGFFDNIYYFKFDNCGRANNKITDYFEVIAFDGTNDIITMYPTMEGEKFTYIDLNDMIKVDVPKIKSLSQIEKFNRRFNR